jgi:hypothetical protein
LGRKGRREIGEDESGRAAGRARPDRIGYSDQDRVSSAPPRERAAPARVGLRGGVDGRGAADDDGRARQARLRRRRGGPRGAAGHAGAGVDGDEVVLELRVEAEEGEEESGEGGGGRDEPVRGLIVAVPQAAEHARKLGVVPRMRADGVAAEGAGVVGDHGAVARLKSRQAAACRSAGLGLGADRARLAVGGTCAVLVFAGQAGDAGLPVEPGVASGACATGQGAAAGRR